MRKNLFSYYILIIIILLIAVNYFIVSSDAFNAKKYYPEVAIVIQVSIDRDTVTVRDSCGNLLQFKGAEDWAVNDTVGLIMNKNNTEKISDDTIIKAQYSAFKIKSD